MKQQKNVFGYEIISFKLAFVLVDRIFSAVPVH